MHDNTFEKNFELKELLDEDGIQYKENGTHLILCECPNCFKKDKLFIDKKTKLWICYSCVKTDQISDNREGVGNLWKLLLTIGFDDIQVKELFKNKKRITYVKDFEFQRMNWSNHDKIEKPNKEVVDHAIPKWFLYLDRSVEQIAQFPEVYEYLWSRHVRTKRQYQEFMLYYDFRKKRVVFPAVTRNMQCIGYQSRDITSRNKEEHPKCDNHECPSRYHYYFKGEEVAPENCPTCGHPIQETFYPKSLNTRDFPKTEFFFNENNINWSEPVILVEGPFDAINAENSMAFLGKVLSTTQFNILIEKNPPQIVLYLDGDSAGDFSTKSIYDQLRAFFNIRIVFSELGEDPGGFSLEVNKKKIQNSLDPHEWYLKKGFMYI